MLVIYVMKITDTLMRDCMHDEYCTVRLINIRTYYADYLMECNHLILPVSEPALISITKRGNVITRPVIIR